MTIDLKGKNIVVTGASDGIGAAMADFLMRMGARVAVHYNTNKEAAQQLIDKYPDTKSKIFGADVSKPNEVISLFEAVEQNFEKIDTIILNAGVFVAHPIQDVLDEWYSVWKKTMAINLDAVGLLTKLGIDHFVKHGKGKFIYIGSRAVFRGETQEYLAYAASKGGLVALARSVARSFGKQNIISIIISPGFTKTKMAEAFIATHGEERVLNEIVLNELTTPQDIVPLVAMISGGYMDHATGATIDINAGSHIR